jgi:arsenate reductase (thioredoxin)
VKKPRKVLFVCIGNSCRSQMAEAFARAYGSDVLIADSAGLYPATMIAPDTVRAMAEKNITLNGQFPKSIEQVDRSAYDLIVDMSGELEPDSAAPVRIWNVPDPIVMDYENHRRVRDQIEFLVQGLISELRGKTKKKKMAIGW